MSNNIFSDFAGGAVQQSFAAGSLSRAETYGKSSDLVPMDQDTQRFADAMKAEDEIQRVRKERENDTPGNRQKAAEAKAAERQRKKIDFHFSRALPSRIMEGWELIGGNRIDEEIRVYTRTYDWEHRFWGIKPIGMTMEDFWERHDPEVSRHQDAQQECPLDPENPTGPLIGEPLKPATETITKSKRRQKSPEINPTHRVRKSKTPSPKISKKGSRKALADKTNAEHSRLEDQLLEEQNVPPATDGPSQDNTTIPPPHPKHKRTTKTKDPAPLKSTQSHPSRKANAVPAPTSPQPPKRPRGRPAKPKPTAKDAVTSSPKRPRGRPPGKGKSTAVQGNAGVTKTSSQQKGRRALAPSTHVMRTRGKGTAELLQL